jgi:pimeloyl-ACP methyl ester carboxylesterase
VLAQDAEALTAHLCLGDYDLVGYSLGGRTAARMLVRGARPRRCVIGGMGDTGVIGLAARVAFFEDAIGNGEAGAYPDAARFIGILMEQARVRPEIMLHVLRSQTPTPEDALRAIDTPILVLSGDRDNDNGTAEGLAAYFPNGRAMRIKGDHFSAANAEFGRAVAEFLS